MRVTLVFDQSLVKISRAWVHVGPCGGACMWGEGVYSLSSPVGDVVAMSVPWSWACVTPMLDQMVVVNSRRSVHVEPQARACSWRGCVYSLSTLEIDVRGLSSSVIAIVDTPGPSLVGAITSQLLEVGRCRDATRYECRHGPYLKPCQSSSGSVAWRPRQLATNPCILADGLDLETPMLAACEHGADNEDE